MRNVILGWTLAATVVGLTFTPDGVSVGNGIAKAGEAKKGWHVRVNTRETEAQSVKLWIGLGGEDSTHHEWKTWNSSDPPEFDLPAEYVHVKEIWIKAESIPRGRNTFLYVRYDDHTTQKMKFDKDEEHETSQDDED